MVDIHFEYVTLGRYRPLLMKIEEFSKIEKISNMYVPFSSTKVGVIRLALRGVFVNNLRNRYLSRNPGGYKILIRECG